MAVTTAIVGALAGCTGGEYATPTAPTTPAVASAPTTSRAFDCPVTRPTVFDPPPGVAPDALFGAGSSYGNGQLWVGGLGDGGLIVRRPNSDGSIGNKFGWWRGTEGSLRITGRRLDAPAAALRADVPSGYGRTGFQASGVSFPTEGCWQVTGQVGTATLTFVTLVLEE